MSNIFNRFFYGKSGKADYTEANMPKNRWELFWQTFRNHSSGIVGMNLIYVLFLLPAIIWTAINLLGVLNALSGVGETMASATEISSESAQTVYSALMGYMTTYLLGMIPCLALAGVGSTGQMYVLRNWARDDHSFVVSDFKDAVSSNWKMGLLTGILNGASLFLAFIGVRVYGSLTNNSLFYVVPQMIVLVCLAVWWMVNMIIFPMMVTYDMKFTQIIRNCVIVVLARLPWSILFLLLSFVPLGILWVCVSEFGFGAIIVGVLYYLLFGFGLNGLIYASYANSCFDCYINPRLDGVELNKGLRPKDYDLDDDEEEEQNNTAGGSRNG
ncbi:MAG: hypothetical protein E7335_09985 [Clostridiales bacterium]|nr:hypothetical protein [Clostridiales bacterium]